MLIKKNIPETTRSFGGGLVESGDRHSLELILNDQANKLQAIRPIVIGNRCGYVPNDPRFYHRPEHHKRRPSILEKAIEILHDAYHWPKKFLKKLLGLNPSKRPTSDLAKSGYIDIVRQFDKKDDDSFKGTPSIRTINVQAFIDLGIDIQKLAWVRDLKRKEREK